METCTSIGKHRLFEAGHSGNWREGEQVENRYKYVRLTKKGEMAAANLRSDARDTLWRGFAITDPTPDEVNEILMFASMAPQGQYFEPVELPYSMTENEALEEAGWREWVDLGIVELE